MSLSEFRRIDIRLDKANDYIPQRIYAKEGDANGRDLYVQLTNDGEVVDTTGISLNLGWTHLSTGGTGLDSFTAEDLSQGIYKHSFTTSFLQPGRVECSIQIVTGTDIVNSRTFIVDVDGSTYDETAVESDNSFTALQDALLTVSSYDGRILNLENTKAEQSYVEGEVDRIDAQLAQKAEKEYVDTLTQSLASGSPKGVYATYNELLGAYPSGNDNIYVVTDGGHWYYWNGSNWISGGVYQGISIGEREIKAENTTFIEKGRNLFDVEALIPGKSIDSTTGEIKDNVNSAITDFIPVKQNTMYSRKNLTAILRYKEDGTFIGGIVNGTTSVNVGVATKVRLSMPLSQVYGQQFQEGETIADDTHGLKLSKQVIDKNKTSIFESLKIKKDNKLYSSWDILNSASTYSSGNAYAVDDYNYVWRTERKSIKVTTTGLTPAFIQGTFPIAQDKEGISEILIALYIPEPIKISALEFHLSMTDGTIWKPSRGGIKDGWNIFRLPATQSTFGTWNNFNYFRIYVHTTGATSFYVGKLCGVIPNKAKIMIVNDHGYSNYKNVAYPQTKALGIPTTWGLNPGRLGGAGGVLTESEIDELANDPYSEINMHAWNPIEKATGDMTADELRVDTLKCIRWIQSKGYQPSHWWRAVFVGNKAPEHEAIQDLVEAYSTPTEAASYDLYPFINKWNVNRISLHGRTPEFFDQVFDVMKKTRCLVVFYTHDIDETDPIDLPESEFNEFMIRLSQAVSEGWVEGTTYSQLKTQYSRVVDTDSLPDYLDTL